MTCNAIGIDFGTKYSCVSVWKNGRAEIIFDENGIKNIPSMVAFDITEHMVGDKAKNQISINPKNTILDIKRLIGRNINDTGVNEDILPLPFSVKNAGGSLKIEVEHKFEMKEFTPQEITSMILTKMKKIAETYLNRPIKDAVISVPLHFNQLQFKAIKDAATMSGLNVLKIINDPVAVGLAYGLQRKSSQVKKVIIYDIGGSSIYASLLEIKNRTFEIKKSARDSNLGGDDFTNRLVYYFANEFELTHKKSLFTLSESILRLKESCERVKRELSTTNEARITISNIILQYKLDNSISRAKFEKHCSNLFKSALEPIKKVIQDSGINKEDIDKIILVGGSARIPKIHSQITDYFNGKKLNIEISPDEAVSKGAAIQAAMLTMKFSDLAEDLILEDVLPLSLGIETVGGFISTIIPANTPIPVKKSRTYVTSCDGQKIINFHVFQGEHPIAKQNKQVYNFCLDNISPRPKGKAKIEVIFSIDENGILSISARNCRSSGLKRITITPNNYRLNIYDI